MWQSPHFALPCAKRSGYLVSWSWLKVLGFHALVPWHDSHLMPKRPLWPLAPSSSFLWQPMQVVAVGALRVDVLAGQREARLLVVEARFLPAVLGVAVGALGAERALVRVVLAVAGVAVLRRLAPALGRLVALAAFHLRVAAAQFVVGLRVVEVALVEHDDARAAALVVGVAVAAGLRLLAAVEAGALTHVAPHVLVAIGAQPVLRIAVELDVALAAVVLDLGVALDHLAGAQHRFDALRPHAAERERQRQCEPP